MKIFVTGGNGFIGRHFVRAALKRGHEVVGLWYPGQPAPQDAAPGLTWVAGSLEDAARSPLLAGNEALVHLAAFGVVPSTSGEDWEACFRWNVTASLGLWRAAAAAGVSKLVICGSCFEYGRSGERYDRIPTDAPLEPVGAYAASKAAATMAALGVGVQPSLRLAVLRPFHVFGEGEHPSRFWPSLKRAALAGEDFPMTRGEQVRDFVPVEQVAQRFLEVLDRGVADAGCPFVENVGTGHPQPLLQFAEIWWQRWEAKGKLLVGKVPYRLGEVMRYVPLVGTKGNP